MSMQNDSPPLEPTYDMLRAGAGELMQIEVHGYESSGEAIDDARRIWKAMFAIWQRENRR